LIGTFPSRRTDFVRRVADAFGGFVVGPGRVAVGTHKVAWVGFVARADGVRWVGALFAVGGFDPLS